MAEARGLLGIRVLEGERYVCWSRGLAQQCDHYNLLGSIAQMGRLRPQKAPIEEAGSPFTRGGLGNMEHTGTSDSGREWGWDGHPWEDIQRVLMPPTSAFMFSRTFCELKAVLVVALG